MISGTRKIQGEQSRHKNRGIESKVDIDRRVDNLVTGTATSIVDKDRGANDPNIGSYGVIGSNSIHRQ